MRKVWVTIFGSATLFALLAVEASATTGNGFRTISDDIQRMAYVVGVIDSWVDVLSSIRDLSGGRSDDPVASAVVIMYGRVAQCVTNERKMLREQILAIVDKYLRDHPAGWDQPAANLIWSALVTCSSRSRSITRSRSRRRLRAARHRSEADTAERSTCRET